MSDCNDLKLRLDGTPFLVADATGEVRLAEKDEMFKIVASGEMATLIPNARVALGRFAKLGWVDNAGQEFSTPSIAKTAGMQYMAFYLRLQQGVMRPSIRANLGKKGTRRRRGEILMARRLRRARIDAVETAPRTIGGSMCALIWPLESLGSLQVGHTSP